MKRAALLLLVLGLVAALGGTAAHAAPRVKAKAVGQSAAKVDRYWTKARMRDATPLDAVRGQAKKKAA